MNNENTRFTLMTFPQSVDKDGKLVLHLLFIPRNINPLTEINTIFGAGNKAQPFADAKPVFSAYVVNNADEFPGKVPANERAIDIAPVYSTQVRAIYETLRDAKKEDGTPKYFDIDESRGADQGGAVAHRAEKPAERETAIRKYLPVSYRKAFNFTSPRVRNAVTDDSYHCAIRDQQPPVPMDNSNKISWGKVYAHLLRQPLMAEKAGLLYKTTITLSAGDFKNGGWLYVDVKNDDPAPYHAEQKKSVTDGGDVFIKRYAARIPVISSDTAGKFIAKTLFSAVLFPVMREGEDAAGVFDTVFIESAQYQDGFARVVHANQPVSANLLSEDRDGFHPQKEMGIRLGWEDEQILIWYLRQMAKDENVDGGNGRLDAPLGVSGYHVDVRNTGAADWESLTAVQSKGNMQLENINIGSFDGELPYQVYPVKLYGLNSEQFWLPMYFSNWNDHSLVLPDKTAAEIYQNDKALKKNGDEVLADQRVSISDTYTAKSNTVKLEYGKQYDFRIRLTDITGGGPPVSVKPGKELPGSVVKAQTFKRYVAPYALQLNDESNEIKSSTEELNFTGSTLRVKRPLLSYPAVVYTRKYAEGEAVNLLKASVAGQMTGISKSAVVGIADPDVVKVAVKVEVQTLQMDNLASDSGRENYITLYNTTRNFDKNNFDAELELSFTYKDFPVLNFSVEKLKPFQNAADDATIAATSGALILPTARNIRLTIRGVGEGDDSYWGSIDERPDYDSRYGKPTVLLMRQESKVETGLLTGLNAARVLQGIFLQPDPPPVYTNQMSADITLPAPDRMPDIVQRLAQQIDVASNKLTLSAEKGERLQFWCSNLIRHTMAPDNSSITFANKNELIDHWLVATTLIISRDWTWDGLAVSSFHIERRKKFWGEYDPEKTADERMDGVTAAFIGDLELRKTAPYQAIQEGSDGKIHREYTRIILIDVLDGLPPAGDKPDAQIVQYTVKPKFIPEIPVPADAVFTTDFLVLPAVVNPTQIPKIVGAGIALSPYIRNEKYSATEARRRYLWLEFDKAPEDERDELFARVLAYAPDQLLSNNAPELFAVPEEPPLPIDPEYIRVFTPASGHEHAGLKAMQKMQHSVAGEDGRHFYLLPLPENLHAESPELFGFYTYEFRFGHGDRLWSTAQGRFGRPFRLTGLQHPAPNLLCTITRDEKFIRVNAPFAKAVFGGKNVTSDPPRTSLWALLYAQVKQADGLGYRNILIDQKKLTVKKARRINPATGGLEYISEEMLTATYNLNPKQKLSIGAQVDVMRREYAQALARQKDATRHGETEWTNAEIETTLRLYGLPEDASMSIICVEVFGTITRLSEHVNNVRRHADRLAQQIEVNLDKDFADDLRDILPKVEETPERDLGNPLTSELGLHRILRTSPLTEVPFICCTE
ncbi:MAG: hypothetical protein INR69_01225 [Mucilaginibacter polytrichastri]|nr:hypothetical protein [Mucilaginibacter polytrichastri]